MTYTPTTEQVRLEYTGDKPDSKCCTNCVEENRAEFDRWYANEIRIAKTHAWDEGYRQGAYDESRYPAIEVETPTPTRRNHEACCAREDHLDGVKHVSAGVDQTQTRQNRGRHPNPHHPHEIRQPLHGGIMSDCQKHKYRIENGLTCVNCGYKEFTQTEAFDRWLNEEIRKAERHGKRTGWSEGYEQGKEDERLAETLQVDVGLGGYAPANRSNPYTEEV